MRVSERIQSLWDRGGPFIGGDRSHGIVTVQTPWEDIATHPENVIFPLGSGLGKMKDRGPVRWFQRADNSQFEIEVPNVKSIGIDRKIGSDAATCQITLTNQWMNFNGDPGNGEDFGNPGYLTPTRGDDLAARARWGHAQNEWHNRLVPNALLRTYEGYGGHGKTRFDAIADGDIVLTGVWLVDNIRLGADGQLNISCRDMMKLLIDQQLFPPLVPTHLYPLKYYRYSYEERQITATSGAYNADLNPDVEPGTAPGDKTMSYRDSSQDRWYGPNANIHGHRGTDATDGMDVTYALSVGNSGPDKIFSTVWWEWDLTPADGINAVYVHPWMGGYQMYVSVMETTGGVDAWQGGATVPYEHEPLIGRQPVVVNTEADIPYVAMFTLPTETSGEYRLPRNYAGKRLRITLRHLVDSGIGPWRYRGGLREVKARVSSGAGDIAATTAPGFSVAPIFYAADEFIDYDDLNKAGYITVSNYGFVDVFGDCREYSANRVDDEAVMDTIRDFITAAGADAGEVSSVALTPTGKGYWILYSRGIVRSFGDAAHYGDIYGAFDYETGAFGGINKAATIVSTYTGLGYWVITFAGEIFEFGDAPAYDNVVTIAGEITHGACGYPAKPTDEDAYGLIVVATYGAVYCYGAATWLGNYNESFNVSNAGQQEIAIDVASTHTGDGYWVMTSAGRVQAFGDAKDHGEADDPIAAQSGFDRYYQLMPASNDEGYLMLDGDGAITPFGSVDYFGAPIPGEKGWLRYDGNYLDFADIIRDLVLWSGFHLKGSTASGDYPAVYGNIENTGMFSKTEMPDEMFDKRPVIDAINELKESVGYLVWVDDEGGFRFESPNWWGPGNFIQSTGEHTADVIEIDERVNLVEYTTEIADENLRSSVIISSGDITGGGLSTIYTDFVPGTADALRGLIKPAMWVNGFFQDRAEQRLMAELISLHIWFSQRVSQIKTVANPCIQVNDQVRVWERVTAESYLHYVRSVSTQHDLETGVYTMTLETNWLGDGDFWVVGDARLGHDQQLFGLSKPLVEFLFRLPAGAAKAGGYELKATAP